MGYKITRDYINENKELVGQGRYRKRDNAGNVIKELTTKDMPHNFRCKDDDGQIYFGGVTNNDSSFAPMDDFQDSYGVTSIEYKNKTTGKWEQL